MSPTLTDLERDRIQMDGYRAYLAGESPTANPYKYGTELGELSHACWAAGYAASRTDRARVNRKASRGESS